MPLPLALPADKRPDPIDPEVAAGWDAWLAGLAATLDEADDIFAAVDSILASWGVAPAGGPPEALSSRHALVEADWYREVDEARWQRARAFTWLWRQFDHTSLALNEALAIRFRALLAPRIFGRCGADPRIFGQVTWTFGYNISLGSGVTIHRGALLDDRGGLEIGDGVSISDGVEIYSHRHSTADIGQVALETTRIGAGARLTVGARILSGLTVGARALVGAGALVTKDVPPATIVGGIPARAFGLVPPE